MAAADLMYADVGGPRTLWDLCTEFCVRHPQTFCTLDQDSNVYNLREGVELPFRVCESLMALRRQVGRLDGQFIHIFSDTARTCIQNADLSGCHITGSALEFIMLQHPNKLDISGCKFLLNSDQVKPLLEKHGFNLEVLFLGNVAPAVFGFKLPSVSASSLWDYSDSEDEDEVPIHVMVLDPVNHDEHEDSVIDCAPTSEGDCGPVDGQDLFRQCPKLQAFSAHCLQGDPVRAASLMKVCLDQYHRLRHLDLSLCHFDLTRLSELPHRQHLMTLVLHGFVFMGSDNVDQSVDFICQLRNLRVLDISCCLESSSLPRPRLNLGRKDHLAHLLSNLPNLKWLDVSTARLAHDQDDVSEEEDQDLGTLFQSRQDNPLEFLGILGCTPAGVLKRLDLPADKITGNASLQQMLFALKVYVKKPQLMMILTTALRTWLYTHNETDISDSQATELCEGVLAAMKKNPFDNEIHHCACDLFNTLEILYNVDHLQPLKRSFISAVVDAMENNVTVEKVIQKSCSFLEGLDWRREIAFILPRLVPILVKLDGEIFSQETHQDILRLIWGIASTTSVSQKVTMGELGVIQVLLENSWKIAQAVEVNPLVTWGMVEDIWGALWSLTDETPENGKRVLDCNGVEYFLKIYGKCDKLWKMVNVVGTLGNIAESDTLRPALLTSECVSVFLNILRQENSTSVYNLYEMFNGAVCALSHMLAGGQAAWTLTEPSREQVAEQVLDCVRQWKPRQPRTVQYRSFAPLVRILQKTEDLAPVLYAVWELNSMLRKKCKKYGRMLLREGGLPLVKHCEQLHPELAPLVTGISEKCQKYIDKHGQPEPRLPDGDLNALQEYHSDEEYRSSDSEFSSDESSMDGDISESLPDSSSDALSSDDSSDDGMDDGDDGFYGGENPIWG